MGGGLHQQMSSNQSQLKPQHQRFADEYLIDFNGGRAYERAGYRAKGKAADAAASRLLANPDVQDYLKEQRAKLAERHSVTLDRVVEQVAFMALGDIRCLFDSMGNLKPIHELTAQEATLLQGLDVFEEFEGRGKDRVFVGETKKVKFVNRLDAAVRLGQHLGGFGRRVEVGGKDGAPIQHEHKGIGEILAEIDEEGAGIPLTQRH